MDKLTEEVRDIIGAKLVYEREFEERARQIITLMTDHNREAAIEALSKAGLAADLYEAISTEIYIEAIIKALTTKEQGEG